MATDYSKLSLAKLEKLSQDLTEKRDALSIEHKAVALELDVRRAQAAASAEVAAMPEARRRALAQLLQAGGIESEEQLGEIGG
jgi:hypothetical protein